MLGHTNGPPVPVEPVNFPIPRFDNLVPGYPSDGIARTLDLVLDPPIRMDDGREIDNLHLEEPTINEVIQAEGELIAGGHVQNVDKYRVALISQASKTPRTVINKMRVSQVYEAYNFLMGFWPPGHRIGVY
jgi:hypothetical protein